MQKKIILLLAISFLFTSVLFAGTTGKLAGKVKDVDGEPIPFANIQLIGTEIGARTNDKGQYIIINIPPGKYDVQISRQGFQPARVEGLKINLDETTIQNMTLSKAVIEMGGISVTAARNELISNSKTSSGITISEDSIENLSVDTIEGIVALQAGTSVVDGELHVRGGRPNEVVFSVDGMSVSDPVDGGAALTIDTDAIKDMKVMTGGFPAEFGNAQSGIVNIITKDGGKEYSGKIELSSDHIIEDADNSNSDVVKFSLGGPVFGSLAPTLRDNFTFFFNGAANWHDTRYKDFYNVNPIDDISTIITSWSNFENYNPYTGRDDVLGFDTGDRNYNNYNANLKMKYIFTPKTNLTFAVRGDQYHNLPFAHNWKYALEHYAETEGTQRQYISTFAHVFNPQMNIKVKASLYEKTIKQNPRGIKRDDFFVLDEANFVLLDPNTPGASTGIIYLTESDGDGVIGDYQNFGWDYETNDGGVENIPSFVKPGSIWGSYFDDMNRELAIKTDFEYQINQIHGLKTGFEIKKHHIEKDRVFNP
jgi:carboxypeptidase family protein/TonB-dependent receptor-like protein